MDEYFQNLLAYLESLKDLKALDDFDMNLIINKKILRVCQAIEEQLNINEDENEDEDDCVGADDSGDGHNDGDCPIEQLVKAIDERIKKQVKLFGRM